MCDAMGAVSCFFFSLVVIVLGGGVGWRWGRRSDVGVVRWGGGWWA